MNSEFTKRPSDENILISNAAIDNRQLFVCLQTIFIEQITMNSTVQQILEILKYILPALIVLWATFLIVNKFLIREIERKQLAIFRENSKGMIQMRLQAYERLTIFVERMHPNSMISRYYVTGATAQDIQLSMVQGIRAEFEHNISQQLYVSPQTWQTVKTVMEQEITMLNRIGASFQMGDSGQLFVQRLSEYVLTTEETLPTSIALDQLNKEAKILLFEGK